MGLLTGLALSMGGYAHDAKEEHLGGFVRDVNDGAEREWCGGGGRCTQVRRLLVPSFGRWNGGNYTLFRQGFGSSYSGYIGWKNGNEHKGCCVCLVQFLDDHRAAGQRDLYGRKSICRL